MDLSTQALLWGLASAVSLPVGAALGLALRPGSRISSAFMAFGAGALLFALSIELLGHVPHYVSEMGNMALYVAVAGAIVGGLVFDTLNQMLNNRGAFLRNLSNAKDFVARTKKARAKRMLRRLSRVKSLQNLPPEPEGRVFFMVLGIEALAAGAMLTMIAETMLPEAFEQGGAIVGLATLCGFLVALSVAALY